MRTVPVIEYIYAVAEAMLNGTAAALARLHIDCIGSGDREGKYTVRGTAL